MRYAVNMPNFGTCADPAVAVSLARDAEAAGWDGFFVWDHVLVDPGWEVPIADPWIILAAIASVTRRIRLGPMVTPLPRRRPIKLARETTTLDHLSHGRLTLGVGLGWPSEAEFGWFGDEVDLATRGSMLDEGLAILEGIWSGRPFEHEGPHFRVRRAAFLPRPLQEPRIPVWVAAMRPFRDPPLRRAARWDGVIATSDSYDPVTPDELRDAVGRCLRHRAPDAGPFDVAVSATTPADDPARAAETVAAYGPAGLTWWHEIVSPMLGSVEAMRERILAGPPTAGKA
jgi:alkanesulfonate monooxygenase SsuD/methylene tetrahydromethanopterin reductase-like flavin-dependent oxidoreductase (luciferase family)